VKKLRLILTILAALYALAFGVASCENGAMSVTTRTVTFDANGGSGAVPGEQTVDAGSAIILPDGNGLSISNYTFGGWNTNALGVGDIYAAQSYFTPDGDITLYARWIHDRKLSSIVRVNQGDSGKAGRCGVACVKMLENYFFGSSNDWDYISDRIVLTTPGGYEASGTGEIGAYLESRGLFTSITKFSDLTKMLTYCEENQIPAIMLTQAVGNPLLGHYVVFAGYNSADGYIAIRDPANKNRTRIHYDDLAALFIQVSEDADIGGNEMIIASDRFIAVKEVTCPDCGKINIFDEAILEALILIECTNCSAALPLAPPVP